MSTSSSAKKRRELRNYTDEHNITLQTLNFLKAVQEERKQLNRQSEENRDKHASERNALQGISRCSQKVILLLFSSTSGFCLPQSPFDVFLVALDLAEC